jgi:hypothetical protein
MIRDNLMIFFRQDRIPDVGDLVFWILETLGPMEDNPQVGAHDPQVYDPTISADYRKFPIVSRLPL